MAARAIINDAKVIYTLIKYYVKLVLSQSQTEMNQILRDLIKKPDGFVKHCWTMNMEFSLQHVKDEDIS